MSNVDTSLIAFKAICNFVNDLSSVYGLIHKPLKLYQRLINKTQISDDKIIKRHLNIFSLFCSTNKENIYKKQKDNLVTRKITYSNRVFIDMSFIFTKTDNETENIIWKHFLTISALVDPTGQAREILKKSLDDNKNCTNEKDFISNILTKVEGSVKADSNPMDAISSIMNSGVFTELVSGMQQGVNTGKFDISKLLGVVQKMVVDMKDQVGDDPQASQALGMLSNITDSVGGGTGPPDLSAMMGLVSSFMSNNLMPDNK